MINREAIFESRDPDRIWKRFCGYFDMTVDEFMDVQRHLLEEQLEVMVESPLWKRLLNGKKPKTMEEFLAVAPITTYWTHYADDIVNIPLQQRERLLNNINRSAWLMDKKVSELLDLARIQIGRVELKIEPLDVSSVVDDLISQLSSLFKNKEQSVETQIQPGLPRARADKERTTEVILNLLSNANKFTPAGGHIVILASSEDDMLQIEVKDTAPIINETDRGRIFDPYYRGGTQEDQQRVSGLGLGLAISKSLVVMQKGEIGVTSEEGRGNTFFFTLPVWREEEREAMR